MEKQELIPHLFRTEYGKITAVLSKLFGIENMEIAGDLASETFLSALETWPYKGVPQNPKAWLYTVAKNKALNYISRNNLFIGKITRDLRTELTENDSVEIDLSEKNIADSQLQMLFAICHPAISVESQIALALRTLCGFGIAEIANALLTNKETINKRLFRAREKLRLEKIEIEEPDSDEIEKRLETVLLTLYLLFNEGYYSESNDAVLREDLCLEAMRLTYFLIANPQTNKPNVNSLLALMCFHASRFAARKNDNGEIILYHDQDELLWNTELINQGAFYLNQASAISTTLSKYYLEGTIAFWNTQKADSVEKWENILHLYNLLLQYEYSPAAALNRVYAVSKVRGKEEGIKEALKLKLLNNPFYFALLGELYNNLDNNLAREYFEKAIDLTLTKSGKQVLQKQLDLII